MDLSERKQRILSSVVTSFISKGEPVGSKSIAEEIGVSSATIRNEMADLIALGLLEQPHTSAGRLPSQKGIRAYLNDLAEEEELTGSEKKLFDSHLLANAYDSEKLLKCVSRLLPLYTKYAAVVTTPNGETATIRAVQFVQISRRAAMLVLMGSSGTVKSRIFHCDFDLSNEIIRMLFRLFNEKLIGMRISEIAIPFVQTFGASLGELSILASPALFALLEAAGEAKVSQVIVTGQMNLIYYPELDYGDVRGIIAFLDRKDGLELLLRQKPGKVTVLVGNESGVHALSDCSVVVARYKIDEADSGGFAVLGPVRMDYAKLISVMRYLSEQVSTLLTALISEQ